MRNLPECEQLEKWSQQWEQIKQFMVLESQIERAKEIMGAKAALPSDVQSIKHEDHSGLTEDEQKRIEATANDKGSDSENQPCAQPGESVLEKQGLFHQEEHAHCEQKTTEADVEKLETGHAAMSLVVQHELGALKREFNHVLDAIGLVPPWVDTQRESGQFLTDDKVLVPQTFSLLNFLLSVKADDYEGFEEEGHLYGCVSPLSDVLFSHRTSVDDVKKSTYQNTLEEYIEVLTERLLMMRERFMAEHAINELTSEKEGAAAKIKDAIKDQFGEMVYEKSIAAIDAKMTEKVKALIDQVCRDQFFVPALSIAQLVDRLKIEESVSKCIAEYHQEKRAEGYLNDYYTLAFRRADTMTDEEVSGLFQRIISIDKKAHIFVIVASVPMIRRVYAMSCASGDYKSIIDAVMIEVCVNGHADIVTKLIQAGADVNATDPNGRTALTHDTLRSGDDYIEMQLIQPGDDANAEDYGEWTALMSACFRGHEVVVSQLIEAGVNVDAKGEDGNTALMLACFRGHDTIVTQLIQAGADCNAIDEKGHTALIIACGCGHEAVVSQLIEAEVNVDAKGEDGNTALIVACKEGHGTIVSQLIQAGADVNAKNNGGWTALLHACDDGHEGIVSKLLQAGANVKASLIGFTALMKACDKGYNRVVQQLIAAGADVYSVHRVCPSITVLTLAISAGHIEIVKTLLEARACLSSGNLVSSAELIEASKKGDEEILKLLIEAGADLDAEDHNGQTALMIACEKGHQVVVDQLIIAGAGINYKDRCGDTALMIACKFDYKRRLDFGDAARMKENKKSHKHIVKQLLEAGADIDIVDKNGKTAFDIAQASGNTEVITMLENARISADETAGSACSP